MNDLVVHTQTLGLATRTRNLLDAYPNPRKRNRLISQIRKNGKLLSVLACEYCGKTFTDSQSTKRCNSHSIPQHCLKNISSDGKVNNINHFLRAPGMKTETGLIQTGTFKLICRECDGRIFKHYEDFSNYTEDLLTNYESPKSQMILNEIAMKDYLYLLYKEMYAKNIINGFIEEYHNIIKINDDINSLRETVEFNINAYRRKFERSKLISKKLNNTTTPIPTTEYRIGLYRIEPLVRPIAFQGSITIEKDFEGQPVNNKLEGSLNDIHLCIFPDRERTILLAFYQKNTKKHGKFFRYINKLGSDNACKALIALALYYSDNIAISKDVPLVTSPSQLSYLEELTSYDGTLLTHYQSNTPLSENRIQDIKNQSIHNHYSLYQPLYSQFTLIPDSLIAPRIID